MIVVTESTSGIHKTWALALFFSLLAAHTSAGQDPKFKLDLFDRGIEQLRSLKETKRVDIENAMETAFAIDPDRLPKELITRCGVPRSLAFRVAVDASPFLVDLKPVFRFLPKEDFTQEDADSIAQLAYTMGTRREDISLLFEVCEGFLTTRNISDDFLLDKSPADKEKVSAAEIRNRRIEYLRFQYGLGRLQNDGTLESAEVFQRGISSSKLKKYLHAVWLACVGTRTLTSTELLKEINGITPKEFAVRVLLESLKKYDQTELKSMVGDVMISHLIRLYFESRPESEESVLELDEFRDRIPDLESMQSLFREPSPNRIIVLAKGCPSFPTEMEIMKHIHAINAKKRIEPALLDSWGQALLQSSLRANNLILAKTIGARFSLKLPATAAFDVAIQQRDLAKAKQIVESHETFNLRQTTVLAASLQIAGRNEEAKVYLDELEEYFTQQLANQADDVKAKWLVNFVFLSGWSMRGVSPKQLPLESTILESFAPLANSPGINETIAKSVDSFTPPTPASRRLLLKMIRTLPESQQIATSFEFNQLAEKIRVAPQADHAQLRKQAVELLNRPVKGNKSDYACRLSFAFAFAGDKEGVNQLIDQISSTEYKSWALFQCAKAFPPRRFPIPKYEYSRRLDGGLF